MAPPNNCSLPSLYRDAAFLGMVATQFLGAFNDNVFKQLMLLLAIPTAMSAHQQDQQGLATIVFSLPFVLGSGYAGYLSDRYRKRTVIIASKVSEIAAMLLGVLAFLLYGTFGNAGLLAVLFLMGWQSTFFGPGKYGILPEMLREEDLPRANGLMLMTTFLAIILGTAIAGVLGDLFVDDSRPLRESAANLWKGSAGCFVIAVAGTLTCLLVRRTAAAKPDLRFQVSALAIPPDARRTLFTDRRLLLALLASSMFWLVAGLAIQAVNQFGINQLDIGMARTSLLTAVIAVGIAVGAMLAGRLSHGKANFRLVRAGLWGILGCLLLLSVSLPDGTHLLGYGGSMIVLMALGLSAAMFAIPLQVFIQARPPAGQKGRMIAVMNQFNFVAILLSGVFFTRFIRIVEGFDWPRSSIFAMMAALVVPGVLFYHPEKGGVNDFG